MLQQRFIEIQEITDTPIKVDRIIYKTFIELDEERTEAAAAAFIGNALGATGTSRPPQPFIADHPFVYFIIENSTGAILFMGRLRGNKTLNFRYV